MKKFKFPMRYVPISATILVFFIVYLILSYGAPPQGNHQLSPVGYAHGQTGT